MPESRDTAPDGSPRTERDAGAPSQVRVTPEVPPVRLTPDVEFDPEERTELNVALKGLEQLPPDSVGAIRTASSVEDRAEDLGGHTPVTVERQAIVGLDRTHRSLGTSSSGLGAGSSGSAAAADGQTTGGHTQRSLSEVERPASSLRALDGRFEAIERKLDQLDARLRLLEKQGAKGESATRSPWLFWVLVLVVLAVFQLLLRRS